MSNANDKHGDSLVMKIRNKRQPCTVLRELKLGYFGIPKFPRTKQYIDTFQVEFNRTISNHCFVLLVALDVAWKSSCQEDSSGNKHSQLPSINYRS
jgi:hypothetical protein